MGIFKVGIDAFYITVWSEAYEGQGVVSLLGLNNWFPAARDYMKRIRRCELLRVCVIGGGFEFSKDSQYS